MRRPEETERWISSLSHHTLQKVLARLVVEDHVSEDLVHRLAIEANIVEASLLGLPKDLLIQIMARVAFRSRLMLVMGVCHSLRAVGFGSPAVWRTVEFRGGWNAKHPLAVVETLHRAVGANAIKRLSLCESLGPDYPRILQLCESLEFLELSGPGVSALLVRSLAAAPAVAHLQSLEFGHCQKARAALTPANLALVLSGMPSLVSLVVGHPLLWTTDTQALVAASGGTGSRLTRLSVNEASAECLANLGELFPRLTDLAIKRLVPVAGVEGSEWTSGMMQTLMTGLLRCSFQHLLRLSLRFHCGFEHTLFRERPDGPIMGLVLRSVLSATPTLQFLEIHTTQQVSGLNGAFADDGSSPALVSLAIAGVDLAKNDFRRLDASRLRRVVLSKCGDVAPGAAAAILTAKPQCRVIIK